MKPGERVRHDVDFEVPAEDLPAPGADRCEHLTVEELEREIVLSAHRSDVEDLNDVRMVHSHRELPFGEEHRRELGIIHEVELEALESEEPAEVRSRRAFLARDEELRDAVAPEGRKDLVFAERYPSHAELRRPRSESEDSTERRSDVGPDLRESSALIRK
jgi:hypothetical protein